MLLRPYNRHRIWRSIRINFYHYHLNTPTIIIIKSHIMYAESQHSYWQYVIYVHMLAIKYWVPLHNVTRDGFRVHLV